MIRSIFLSMALLGLLFQNVQAAAPQDDLCKVEQDHINTAVYLEGMLTQNFRACAKGTISYIEVIASVDFAGGQVDVAIMDDTFATKAMQTFTASNYNGTSLILENLAIPTLTHDEYTLVVRAMNGASCVIPGTDEPTQFVGGARLHGEVLDKNVKFSSGIRSATPSLGSAQDGRKDDIRSNDLPNNAMSRTAAGLDLRVQGDCAAEQLQSNGVINVNGGTFMQSFYSCERGQFLEAKLATPYVEAGYTFEYALMHFNGDVIANGTFTEENVTDGELHLTFDKGSVRKGQHVALKVTCPEGARIALLAIGVANADFGRLYVDGQSLSFNLAIAAGLKSAIAADVTAEDEGRGAIDLSAFPNPFTDVLNVQVRGTVQEGALLQILDQQGMPVKALSLSGGKLDRPVRIDDCGELRPGIYSLRLLNGREAVSIRVLKN
jgi:hypothetical protein